MLIIQGRRVVLPTGERPASIHIDNGVIVDVRDYYDVGDATDMWTGARPSYAGSRDSHVHVNDLVEPTGKDLTRTPRRHHDGTCPVHDVCRVTDIVVVADVHDDALSM